MSLVSRVGGVWVVEGRREGGESSFVCLLESVCGVGEGIERTEKGYYGGAQGWGVCLWCVCQKMTMSRASEGVRSAAVSPPPPDPERKKPFPPCNTLRDMDVQELRSPGHPRNNRALSRVALSKKRKRAPLQFSIIYRACPPFLSSCVRRRGGFGGKGSRVKEPLEAVQVWQG